MIFGIVLPPLRYLYLLLQQDCGAKIHGTVLRTSYHSKIRTGTRNILLTREASGSMKLFSHDICVISHQQLRHVTQTAFGAFPTFSTATHSICFFPLSFHSVHKHYRYIYIYTDKYTHTVTTSDPQSTNIPCRPRKRFRVRIIRIPYVYYTVLPRGIPNKLPKI